MRTPLLAGREFTERDAGSNPTVAVVSEAFVARYLPARNPIGQHLSASIAGGRPTDLEIVGVAKNVASNGLRRAPYPALYLSYAQLTRNFSTTVEIRANGALAQVAWSIRQEFQQSLPNTPIEIHALTEQVEATLVQERMMATLASSFGGLALVLACVGLYGLLAYSVARRTKEMGIRMALGAQRRRVIGMVVKGAIRLVAIGIAVGLPAAWFASRWVKSMLFGLTPTDPTTIAGAALVLASAALLAAYLPARRAARVDPMTALRHE
jgi:predicted permease